MIGNDGKIIEQADSQDTWYQSAARSLSTMAAAPFEALHPAAEVDSAMLAQKRLQRFSAQACPPLVKSPRQPVVASSVAAGPVVAPTEDVSVAQQLFDLTL
eukprot:TRINITY_DN65105_c0_g1_i1.p2 TRINITY_DN65105_c0_g1~~TRINITY_DN65105_c0_g1_i1.p2  ORF type:complete len:101 (-),score=24.59 TRINITY_DN65105_c0_g1_i1:198-500(-)